MSARPQRLRVRAHAATARASALVFGDDGPALALTSAPVAPRPGRLALCGPEPACAQSAEAEGWAVQVSAQLRGPDAGSWTGLTLADVGAVDPTGLARWLADPDARPHGGETLSELVLRVGDLLQHPSAGDADLGDGPQLWVAAPLTVRALVVAALGAPPAVLFGVDVGFGGEVQLSGGGRTWRLQALRRG